MSQQGLMKIKDIPDKPGVYIFKDAEGRLLYIGKAKSLKKRVYSYFQRPVDAKTQSLVSKIADIECRLTPSEVQAQLLEAALVQALKPRYNIELKDDKSFPWVRISAEEFPVVSICRRKKRLKNERALYFGPYTSVKPLREAFRLMRRIFGFRSCVRMPETPCLYHRLRLCPAPCAGKITVTAYQGIIRQVRLFLNSRYEELLQELNQKMHQAAAQKDFESAARLRDQISCLAAFNSSPLNAAASSEQEELRRVLKLDKPPLRIEAFDISNISGRQATGAMVSFYKAQPDKNNYRRFRIQLDCGIDDYAMLREVVRRRYQRLVREQAALPDLLLVDGGRGQLLAADSEIKKLGLDLAVVALAKEKENIYISGRKFPLRLKEGCLALNLIRRIRDEAHRFALKYHCLLRRKKVLGSEAKDKKKTA
jgi:excinuclease ABC subunit C